MFQPLATPSHAGHLHSGSAQWTVTYPTLVAPRPLRPSAHAHYHPYHPGANVGRTGSARHTRVPPRLRVVPSPAEALARISLVDQPTPPPDVPDESSTQNYGYVATRSRPCGCAHLLIFQDCIHALIRDARGVFEDPAERWGSCFTCTNTRNRGTRDI